MRTNFIPMFLAVLPIAAPTVALAINCNTEKTQTENLICKSKDLRQLDESLNIVYRAAIKKAKNQDLLKSAQKHWITEVRDKCKTSECLVASYTTQINNLSNSMSSWCRSQNANIPGMWQRIGEGGFFEEFSTGPDGQFDSWLHQRPETSGTWVLTGCTLMMRSDTGITIAWKLLDITKSELKVIEISPAGLARDRRSTH